MAKESFRVTPLHGEAFGFACHPGVSCFTECCRDLDLSLMPYDILRMKRNLGLTSQEVLETYCSSHMTTQSGLPEVKLEMTDAPGRPCPFVRPEGCAIYQDRPGACRTYPLARASSADGHGGTVVEAYLMMEEGHCRGFEQDQTWTVGQWRENQGLELYDRWNDELCNIYSAVAQRGEGVDYRKMQMMYMACWDLDRFRQFVFQTRFLEAFDLGDRLEGIQGDEEALLALAFDWVAFMLLGEPRLRLKAGKR